MNESPQKQWFGYKQAAYSKTLLTPHQEKECSQCFYAGMMAGLSSGVVLSNTYKGARRHKELKKFFADIKFVALSSHPTGNN